MIVLEVPNIAPYLGLGIGVVLFAVQALLCFRAKGRHVRRMPGYVLAVCWLLLLLLAAGVFGTLGTDNPEVPLYIAKLLATVTAGPTVGVLAAWALYRLSRRPESYRLFAFALAVVCTITGITAALEAASASERERLAEEAVVEYTAEDEVETNARGWLLDGGDNRRINIYADNESVLLIDSKVLSEKLEHVYACDGSELGSVWAVGASGRKLYALNNGTYTVYGSGTVKVEYMDSGYYERIVEYELGDSAAPISVGDFSSQTVTCATGEEPSRVYTAAELAELNADE